jgi:hypothetical protein
VTTCSVASCSDGTVPVFTCGSANTCLPSRSHLARCVPVPHRHLRPLQDADEWAPAQTGHRGRARREHGLENARTAHVDVRPNRQQLDHRTAYAAGLLPSADGTRPERGLASHP